MKYKYVVVHYYDSRSEETIISYIARFPEGATELEISKAINGEKYVTVPVITFEKKTIPVYVAKEKEDEE